MNNEVVFTGTGTKHGTGDVYASHRWVTDRFNSLAVGVCLYRGTYT